MPHENNVHFGAMGGLIKISFIHVSKICALSD